MIRVSYNKEIKKFSVNRSFSNEQVFIVVGLTPYQELLEREVKADNSSDAIKQVENVTNGKGVVMKCTRLKAFKAHKELRQVNRDGSKKEMWVSPEAERYSLEIEDYIRHNFNR